MTQKYKVKLENWPPQRDKFEVKKLENQNNKNSIKKSKKFNKNRIVRQY